MADDVVMVYDNRGNPFPVKSSMLTPEARQELIYNIPQGAPPPDAAAPMNAPQAPVEQPKPQMQPPTPQQPPPSNTGPAPQYPDMVRVPGGKPKMTPDEQFMLDAKHREGQGALEQVDAQKSGLNSMTALSGDMQKYDDEAMLQREQRFKQHQEMVMSDMKGLESRISDYNSKRIDPDAGWNNASTGTKVAAVIATILGALGGNRYDANNPSPIQKIINDDLEAQKLRMQEDKERIMLSRQSLDDKKQALAGLDQEWEELQIKHLENFRHKADYLLQSAQGPEMEAKKKQLQAQIDQLERSALMGYKNAAARRAQGALAVNIASPGQKPVYVPMSGKDAAKYGMDKQKLAGENAGRALESEYKQSQIQKNRLEVSEKEQQLMPEIPGLTRTGEKATPPSSTELTKIREGVGASRNLRNTLDRLQALAEKHWGTNRIWDPKDVAEANALRQQAITQYRVIENTGTPQEGEIKRFEERIPDPTGLSWTKQETFQALRDQAAQRMQDVLHPYGMALEDAKPSSWVPKE